MRLEKAYSEELGKNITAKEADIEFARENIESKSSFTCPDRNCTAQVTCANLDKPEHLRKREPYFKVIGEHKDACLIGKKIEKQNKNGEKRLSEGSDGSGGALILRLPPGENREDNVVTVDGGGKTTGSIKNGNSSNIGAGKTVSEISLASIVAGFPANKSTILNIRDVVGISIQDFFIEIKGQEIDELPDEWRIYYGKAWFNKSSRAPGYYIKFYNKLSSAGFSKKPSIFISSDKIEASGNKKFRPETMKNLIGNNFGQFFILSKKRPYVNGGYINIHWKNLRYIEYKEL